VLSYTSDAIFREKEVFSHFVGAKNITQEAEAM
jgi:hypothetical protein